MGINDTPLIEKAQICKNMSTVEESLRMFPDLHDFARFIPSDGEVNEEPKYCDSICSGKPFEITLRRFFSCSSTLKSAVASFLYQNLDDVVRESSNGLSLQNLRAAYNYIESSGAPDTKEKAKAMVENLGKETVEILMEHPEILAQVLQLELTANQITEIQKHLMSVVN